MAAIVGNTLVLKTNVSNKVASSRKPVPSALSKPVAKGQAARTSLTVTMSSDNESRRQALLSMAGAAALTLTPAMQASPALAAGSQASTLCDAECLQLLSSIEMVTTASGLQYKDIIKGSGPSPVQGQQILVDWVAMVTNPKDGSLFAFDDTITKGKPMDVRVFDNPEIADLILGLNEGIASMKVGGVRRLYIPGALAFPKGLASAPGRPRVAPASDVVFDVKMLLIPGVDEDDEEDYVLEI